MKRLGMAMLMAAMLVGPVVGTATATPQKAAAVKVIRWTAKKVGQAIGEYKKAKQTIDQNTRDAERRLREQKNRRRR